MDSAIAELVVAAIFTLRGCSPDMESAPWFPFKAAVASNEIAKKKLAHEAGSRIAAALSPNGIFPLSGTVEPQRQRDQKHKSIQAMKAVLVPLAGSARSGNIIHLSDGLSRCSRFEAKREFFEPVPPRPQCDSGFWHRTPGVCHKTAPPIFYRNFLSDAAY